MPKIPVLGLEEEREEGPHSVPLLPNPGPGRDKSLKHHQDMGQRPKGHD